MTPTQFRAALNRLGLTQVGAARLFDVDGRTARRWIAGDLPVPTAVAVLINLLLSGKIQISDIEKSKR